MDSVKFIEAMNSFTDYNDFSVVYAVIFEENSHPKGTINIFSRAEVDDAIVFKVGTDGYQEVIDAINLGSFKKIKESQHKTQEGSRKAR